MIPGFEIPDPEMPGLDVIWEADAELGRCISEVIPDDPIGA